MHLLALLALTAAALLTSACASQPAGRNLDVTRRVDHIDLIAREPMVLEHPDGSLFVAGYGEPHPALWRSADRGVTWSRVVVGTEAEGAVGNSDVDLAVASDGTLYFATMLFDRAVGEGRQIAVGVSADAGATWRWTTLSKTRFDDRPWAGVASDGTAHVIWNDGNGVKHVVSRDGGATWTSPRRVHDKGGSSSLAVAAGGEVAVRITPASASANKFDEGVELLAVSTDGGESWQKHPAPGLRDWFADFEKPGATPRWVEPIAWDDSGSLFYLWTDKAGVQLARSSDRGASWKSWLVKPSSDQAFFPYLVARGNGELAATWFSAADANWKDLRWHVARIDVGTDGAPRVTMASPRVLESARPRQGQGDALFNDPGGEYLSITFLRDGSLGVATPIQNKSAKRFGFTWWTFGGRQD